MVKAAVGTRAAWVVDPESDVVVSAASERRRPSARTTPRGCRLPRAPRLPRRRRLGVAEAGLPIETTPAVDISGLAERLSRGDVRLLDVREDDEWEEGHVEGSMHIPYHELRDGVPAELANGDGRQIAVVCSAGNRSSIAASLLRRSGVENVLHVAERRRRGPRKRGSRAGPGRVMPPTLLATLGPARRRSSVG